VGPRGERRAAVRRPERGAVRIGGTDREWNGLAIHVGVILSCVDTEFLDARIELDEARVLALDATPDLEANHEGLATHHGGVCRGADAGAIGALPPRGRFRWLVPPRSTVIQVSPAHTGRTTDPPAALERLMETMVRHHTAKP